MCCYVIFEVLKTSRDVLDCIYMHVCVCVCDVYFEHLFVWNPFVLLHLFTTVLHVNVKGKLSLNYPLFQRSALPRVLGNI